MAAIYVDSGELYVADPAGKNDRQISPVKHNYDFYSANYSSQIILYKKQ